ncbi:dihydrolipoamide acetyltransferase family protein [Amycolatopsis sp.]|uniref:dihydrolipoamide acetyltransferase family protein n=1 Tax=Amycolatopsis sp. TaxID=37632 RepID=UPI002C8882E8|nr:dihydrolipoamide acetyltransferase family protein [Amycolatopsis sp.]HVV08560.1 dihydrolipoamide acetyltransferase family protein [Amycolatopsis sp.]
MPEITMPRLSDTMEEGVIVAWRKQAGDKVSPGEVLAEIETDKAIMELEAYDEGVLERVLAKEGEKVAIGTPIAVVGDGSGKASEPTPAPIAAAAPAAAPDRPKASPLARKIAREQGVDLAQVTGSGPGGRIIRRDVESAPAPAPVQVAAGDYEEVPLTSIQRVAAKRLTESKRDAPHFYLTAAVDVTELLAFRGTVNDAVQSAGGAKVSVNDLLLRAVAITLRANPAVNVSFAGDKLLRHNGVHVGVAVAVPAGLVVPVIRDTDRKAVSEIAVESREKAERARDGKLRADEMSGGTFTVSNLGMFGIEQFAAVINPPEAAILAVGAATPELRLIDGEVIERKILRLTLSADHRAIDGATGAVFLQQLTGLLENPLRIVA